MASDMTLTRRSLLVAAAATTAPTAAIGQASTRAAAALGTFGLDSAQFGLRPGSPDDQSQSFRRALAEAAARNAPLMLAPGRYLIDGTMLPDGIRIVGVPGATWLVQSGSGPLLVGRGLERAQLVGVGFDGRDRPAGERALVTLESVREIAMEDCAVIGVGIGLSLIRSGGHVSTSRFEDIGSVALLSLDATGLAIRDNVIERCGNNGIQVWRSSNGDDGTIVEGNRIADIRAAAGGSGQNGNAVNVFRAGNVSVRGNRIKGAAFSAVRGNAASNLQVAGNTCSALGEVALYAEFGFEGAVIANNVVDGAAIGVAVTNFNEGGRLAVVQGNLIRNLLPTRPAGTDPNDGAGIGIGVEADSAVTGNVIENAPSFGIAIGWGRHLRDVAVTGNVVRKAGIGIGVSVSWGAGAALIANNVISEAANGAIVGMDRHRIVTSDVTQLANGRAATLRIADNLVR